MIPDWSSSGVLPPIMKGAQANIVDQSPYRSDLLELSVRFKTSSERAALLSNLLNYRRDMRQAGINSGFQWVDGSFVEDVENLRGRPPADIDLVNFCHVPTGLTQKDLVKNHPELFIQPMIKSKYKMDAYFVFLGSSLDKPIIDQVSYWNNFWGHRRDQTWKGFIEVDLDLANGNDIDAGIHLKTPIT
jgi:hypothetical protein